MERWVTSRTAIGTPFDGATEVLVNEPAALLPTDHRIHPCGGAVLTLSAGTGAGAEAGHDVVLRFGAPCSAEGEAWLPVEWAPTSHSHVLPSFRGVVELIDGPERTELGITGTYDVPLGVLGRFGDGLLGRRVALQSVRTLLESMANQLRARVAATEVPAGWKPAPHPIDVRDGPIPDLPERGNPE
jgi:hypothetical protein